MESDPFAVLDREGVGSLMKQAIAAGRKSRPGIKLGICGEHGGDPSSVEFCHELGLDYVSCSPYRVAIARLAAAHAALAEADAKKSAGKTSRSASKPKPPARRSRAARKRR
jgi:pyruvate, orthophosphate dikinase